MGKIEVPFNEWSVEHLLNKEPVKRATSRTYRLGTVGDYFYVRDAKFVLTEIAYLPLARVQEEHHREEGAKTPSAFKEKWETIYGWWRPHQEVYFHRFKRVATTKQLSLNIQP